MADLFDLPLVPQDDRLDRIPFISRFAVPFTVAWIGVFMLIEGDHRKARHHPWLWKIAAHLRVYFSSPQRDKQLVCKVRYVQDHLVGLIVEGKQPADSLMVRVDAVEWAQTWSSGNLLIIYGLSPRVDYTVHLEDGNGSYCDLTLSTNVPESDSQAGVRRQTPMTTLLEAREIAVNTLAEEKAKYKKLRKENNKVLAQLRQEIDAHSAKYSRSSKNDERISRKLQTLQDTIKQLQEDIRDAEDATFELEKSKPESDAVFALREKEYMDETARLSAQEVELDERLHELSQMESTLEQEALRNETRKTKQQQKLAKLTDEIAAMRKSTSSAMTSVIARRENLRQQKIRRRMTQQAEFEASIRQLELGVQDVVARTRLFEEARSTW